MYTGTYEPVALNFLLPLDGGRCCDHIPYHYYTTILVLMVAYATMYNSITPGDKAAHPLGRIS